MSGDIRSGSEAEGVPSVRLVARAGLPTPCGGFEMFVYEGPDHVEHVALTTGFGPSEAAS